MDAGLGQVPLAGTLVGHSEAEDLGGPVDLDIDGRTDGGLPGHREVVLGLDLDGLETGTGERARLRQGGPEGIHGDAELARGLAVAGHGPPGVPASFGRLRSEGQGGAVVEGEGVGVHGQSPCEFDHGPLVTLGAVALFRGRSDQVPESSRRP